MFTESETEERVSTGSYPVKGKCIKTFAYLGVGTCWQKKLFRVRGRVSTLICEGAPLNNRRESILLP